MKKREMIKSIVFMELAILMSFGMFFIGVYSFNYIFVWIGVCLFPVMLYSILRYENIMDRM